MFNEHPCSITSHKLTNLCPTLQAPVRIFVLVLIYWAARIVPVLRPCTSFQNFALAWKCLQILTQTCKTLQKIAKPCTTLHVSVLVLTYWAALRQFIGLIARQAAPYVYHCTFCMIINLGFNFAANIIVWLRHL